MAFADMQELFLSDERFVDHGPLVICILICIVSNKLQKKKKNPAGLVGNGAVLYWIQ